MASFLTLFYLLLGEPLELLPLTGFYFLVFHPSLLSQQRRTCQNSHILFKVPTILFAGVGGIIILNPACLPHGDTFQGFCLGPPKCFGGEGARRIISLFRRLMRNRPSPPPPMLSSSLNRPHRVFHLPPLPLPYGASHPLRLQWKMFRRSE